MRVVSRVLVAAVFVALPRFAAGQSVGTHSAGLQSAAPMSAGTPSLLLDGGQAQGVSVVTATGIDPAGAADQTANPGDAAPAASDRGPSLSAATAGIRANTSDNLTTQRADHHGGLGTGGALMIVGGAALIIGLIVGGTAGIIVAIAGAAVGLYGLFLFLQ